MKPCSYYDEDEDLMSLTPEFDISGLTPSAQRRAKRFNDMETSLAYSRASRIVNHNKVTMVAVLCQGQVDETVSILLQRNPHKFVAQNLIALSQANAMYLARTICNDNDDWR